MKKEQVNQAVSALIDEIFAARGNSDSSQKIATAVRNFQSNFSSSSSGSSSSRSSSRHSK